MRHKVTDYATLVFDCDGVVLNSNKIKTDAFYQTALLYGEAAAEAMVAFHVANGGVSRYRKFAYFLEHVVPEKAPGCAAPGLDALLEDYADKVRQGLMTCEMAEGLRELRKKTQNARWLIVSGGDQNELREVFELRGQSELFDGGIYGSPATKDEILAREISNHTINFPALFFGDSKYDFEAAEKGGLDFIFVSGWSEVIDWKRWCQDKSIREVENIKSAMQL